MATNPDPLNEIEGAPGRMAKNACLYRWLGDEAGRAALYEGMRQQARQVLEFPSRADADPPAAVQGNPPSMYADASPPVPPGHTTAYLVTGAAALEVLINKQLPGEKGQSGMSPYSNAPYKALGGGTFMLALDGKPQQEQRGLVKRVMLGAAASPQEMRLLANYAATAALIRPLKQGEFDLAPLAQEAALIYLCLMWGLPLKALPVLVPAFDGMYRALNFRLLARHFEPASLARARELKEGADLLSAAISKWIDAYLRYRPHEQGHVPRLDDPPIAQDLLAAVVRAREALLEARLKELALTKGTPVSDEDRKQAEETAKSYVPLLARLPSHWDPAQAEGQVLTTDLSSKDLAGLVIGMMAGAVGQIQSSVCHAVREARRQSDDERRAELVKQLSEGDAGEVLLDLLFGDPPAPFLARRTACAVTLAGVKIPAGSELVLATASFPEPLTAAEASHEPLVPDPKDTSGPSFSTDPKALKAARVFGFGAHECIGKAVAVPLIGALVARVLSLPGLADVYDPVTRKPRGLMQTWGSVCESYPLQYELSKRMGHGPLCFRMKVKAPVGEHAARIREILKYGAARIEASLNRTQIVHVAWFQLVDQDTTLVLNTVFDGDMAAYLRAFAELEFPVFDALFDHLEESPPLPVRLFQREFVELVMRHHQPPEAGYFYSAHPLATVKPRPGPGAAQ